MEITEQDRKEFPHHTDGSILGIKLVRAQTTEDLKEVLRRSDKHEALRLQVGKSTNPSWLTGVVAEELFRRNEITAQQLHFIAENDGLVMSI